MNDMPDNTVEVDGSKGEGGGQILRTSLSLSAITGRPLRMRHIRARRRKAGLMRQHLTAVRAAAEICDAEVDGDELRSSGLTFVPGPVRSGHYEFRVGTAGSITLIWQTVLWPLLLASGTSTVRLEGGTHNPMAPPFDFLERSLLPYLRTMGADAELVLERAGFYPAGGGVLTATIGGNASLRPLEILHRGEVQEVRARAQLSELPGNIARRELDVVHQRLEWPRDCLHIEPLESVGPGNVLLLEAQHEGGRTVVVGFGEKGISAESVAARCCGRYEQWFEADVPIGRHLADQLLIPMALAGGGSFRTLAPTRHTQSNAALIERWLPVKIEFTDEGTDAWRVDVRATEADLPR